MSTSSSIQAGLLRCQWWLLRNYQGYVQQIKIDGKISEAFRILKGTEQGHPLSPELFKVYFKKLSDLLNETLADCPTLAGLSVTHLAWTDDLFILALDQDSLQKLFDIIATYCGLGIGNQHL